MAEHGNVLSRNPNICACCSSMTDGMEEPALPEAELDPEVAGAPKARRSGGNFNPQRQPSLRGDLSAGL